MSKNIFIIGNGFDLDLGWKTRFSDFAKSNFWPNSNNFSISDLQRHLEEKKGTERWFDLENELLNYADIKNQQDGDTRYIFGGYQHDIIFYRSLHTALTEYLKEQEKLSINKNSTAAKILKAIKENGYFSSIYTFNYTDLNAISKRLNVSDNIQHRHIHGKLSDDSIIIGVDQTPLMKGYDEFHKTMSEHYRSNNMSEDLKTSDEVVFFGISFGKIDYSYFDIFFQSQADRSPKMSRKHITIFTYDENSRKDILLKLTEMGINLQHLYSQCDFQIIRTAEPKDQKYIDEFIKRLDETSARATIRMNKPKGVKIK